MILNTQYETTKKAVMLARDSIAGEPIIKAKREIYLPHPYPEKKGTEEGRGAYERYLANAEYDNVPSATLKALTGAMFRSRPEIIAPDYLVEDADGDGQSLEQMMKVSASELLLMNYQFLLAEYSSLASVDVDELSVEQLNGLGLRPYIKAYKRESIKDWDFRKINGKLQLSYLLLCETETKIVDGNRQQIESELTLALDDEGYYYQQKKVIQGEGGESDRIYPLMGGQRIRYITGEFAIADVVPKGDIPAALGYIYPISSKSITRYKVSADYRETLWLNGAPITTSTGWTEQAYQLYKDMTGNEYISTGPGSHLPLAEGATFGLHGGDASVCGAYAAKMKTNAAEIRALGGVFDTTTQDEQTATAASINAAEKSGVLALVASEIESVYTTVIGYCQEYEGVRSEVEIGLTREFSAVMLSPQQRAQIRDDWAMGLISREEALRQMERGGVLVQTAEEILNQQEV